MKKIVYICDVCGRELPKDCFIADITATLGDGVVMQLSDICPDCAKLIYERLNNMIIEKDND